MMQMMKRRECLIKLNTKNAGHCEYIHANRATDLEDYKSWKPRCAPNDSTVTKLAAELLYYITVNPL